MIFSPKKKTRNIILSLVVLVFIFQVSAIAFLFPLEAKAQPVVTDPTSLAQRISIQFKETAREMWKNTKEKLGENLFKGMLLTVSVTLKNTMIRMAQQAAEQTVTYISTGSWGKGPMFYDQAMEEFSANLKDSAVNEFVKNMNSVYGIDICHPTLPSDELNLKLGLQFAYLDVRGDETAPLDCTFNDLKGNWEAFGELIEAKYNKVLEKIDDPYGTSLAYLQESFDVGFSPSKSGIGSYLTMEGDLIEEQRQTVEDKVAQRKENEGFKGASGVTGKNIKTPAVLTRSHTAAEIEKAKATPDAELKLAGEVMTEIPFQVPVAFLNTFVSKLWTDYIKDKIFVKGLANKPNDFNPLTQVYETGEQLEKEFASKKINFTIATKQIDLLSEFVNCPISGRTDVSQINNCVMSADFAEAVRQSNQGTPITVQEAIDQNLISGSMVFIGPNDPRDNNSNCLDEGYCYSNLVKMRKARIIPIGWEIAAEKLEGGPAVKLQEVIDGFYDCDAGTPANSGPYCHLIDPNWVLKNPQTQCQASVAGPVLLATGAAERQEVCVDTPSCISENEDGSCKGWGYCAAESGTFKFGGQSCLGAYDSCRDLKNSKGKQVGVLLNTVDQSTCNESNVGCLWYSSWRDPSNQFTWSDLASKKVYLNSKINNFECPPDAEGCTRMVQAKPGIGTNLVSNGGFEYFDGVYALGGTYFVPGWDGGPYIIDGEDKLSGDYALNLFVQSGSTETLESDWITVAQNPGERYFAVSAKVNKSNTGDVSVDFDLGMTNWAAAFNIRLIDEYISEENDDLGVWTDVYRVVAISSAENALSMIPELYQKMKVVITSEATIYLDEVMLEELDLPTEEARHVYNDYAGQNIKYMKKAPEYLSCYNAGVGFCGDEFANANNGVACQQNEDCVGEVFATNDPALFCNFNVSDDFYGRPTKPENIALFDDVAPVDGIKGCSDFTELCSAEEVGCDGYSPTDQGNTVFGTVAYNDYCPQECNGYSSYKQASSFFANEIFPMYFIPETGNSCNSAEAGCEEFTNLDELSAGGEAKEYFTEMRLCRKLPDDAHLCGNYYTWEGDDVSGYQLQAYTLQEESSGPNSGAPKLVMDSYIAECNATIFEQKSNPDCRQFFDEAGNSYFRIMSKTISCSENCYPYRRTIKYATAEECTERQGVWQGGECVFMTIPDEGQTCSASNAGCKEYRGNQAGVEEIIVNHTFEPETLDNDLGQFIYSQATSYISPEFGPFLKVSGDTPFIYTNPEQVSLDYGDYSVSFWVKTSLGTTGDFGIYVQDDGNIDVGSGELIFQGQVTDNFTYHEARISAEKLGSGKALGIEAISSTLHVMDIDNFKVAKVNDYKYVIENTWKTPTTCDFKLNTDTTDQANYLAQAHLGCREYNDTDGTKHYLKSFSSLCSSDKIGCQAMIDTKNSLNPFDKKYTNVIPNETICSTVVRNWDIFLIGNSSLAGSKTTGKVTTEADRCWIQIITQNGEIEDNNAPLLNVLCENFDDYVPGEYEWDDLQDKCLSTQDTVEKDQLMYLVYDRNKQCIDTEKGCTALGLPNLSVATEDVDIDNDGTVDYTSGDYYVADPAKDWNNVFYRLDPDIYEEINSPLCGNLESGCEKFTDSTGSTLYFRNPGDKTCFYGSNSVGQQKVYGWYTKDKDNNLVPCEEKSYYNDGANQLIKTTDPDYVGWVGLCSSTEDMCTAFVDPTDVDVETRTGKAYYYINNESIDNSSCNSVSRKDGCILMNDTSVIDENGNPYLPWFSFETYIKSANEGFTSQAPLTASAISSSFSPDCSNYDYCEEAVACLALEKGIAECLKIASVDDSDPAKQGIQPYCSNDSAACSIVKTLGADSNKIIKLDRDRECSAWYDCQSSHWNWDSENSEYVEVCDRIGLCEALTDDIDSPECAKFVKNNDVKNILSENTKVMESYIDPARGVGWYDYDYSGMAIPDLNPIQFYNSFDYKEFSKTENDDYRLLVNAVNNKCTDVSNCCAEPGGDPSSCPKASASGSSKVQCLNSVCVYSFDSYQNISTAPSPECRAYPDLAAPFTLSPENRDVANYENANVFENVAGMNYNKDYGCFYTEMSYGGGTITKYFPKEFAADYRDVNYCQDDENKICTCDGAGEYPINNDQMCSSSACGGTGSDASMCLKPDSRQLREFAGWQGFCLERDLSNVMNNDQNQHPCITWYPTQGLSGINDVGNSFYSAGYNPSIDSGQIFVTNTKGLNKQMVPDKDSAFDIPYVKAFASLGASEWAIISGALTSNIPSSPELPHTILSTQTETYIENYVEDATAYKKYRFAEKDLIGLVFHCVDGASSDWCDNGTPGDEINNNIGNEVLKIDEKVVKGTFLPAKQTVYQSSAQGEGYRLIAKRPLAADGYMVWCEDSDRWLQVNKENAGEVEGCVGKNIANWTYWEYVWWQTSKNSSGNVHNEKDLMPSFISSGPDSETDDYLGDYVHDEGDGVTFSPLFRMNGYTASGCRNVLTNTYLPIEACDANPNTTAGISPRVYFPSDYDPDGDGNVNPPDGKNQLGTVKACSQIKLSSDDCPGIWEDGNYNENGKGACVDYSGAGEYVCSNVLCNKNENDATTQDNPKCVENYTCDNGTKTQTSIKSKCMPKKVVTFEETSDRFKDNNIKQECEFLEGEGQDLGDNYFGVRVLFDETGRYQGVWYSGCDNSDNDGWQKMKLSAVLAETADELVQVHDFDTEENKAFTDTIYQYYRKSLAGAPDRFVKTVGVSTTEKGKIEYSSFNEPFGSASIIGFSPSDLELPVYIPDTTNEAKGAGASDSALQPGGSPWVRLLGSSHAGPYRTGGKPWGCNQENMSDVNGFVGQTQQCDGTQANTDELVESTNNADPNFIPENTPDLSTLFAKIYKRWAWSRSTSSYEVATPEGEYFIDYSGDQSIGNDNYHPKGPQVKQLSQSDPSYNGMNVVGINGITISTNSGDHNSGDIQGTNGQMRIAVKFYAWAADEQMPIRRVIVDWGDGQRYTENQGWFKNHKPFCLAEDYVAPGETEQIMGLCASHDIPLKGQSCPCENGECNDDACSGNLTCNAPGSANFYSSDRRFGDLPRACQPGYFSYENVYVCDEVSSLPACDINGDGTISGNAELRLSPCQYSDPTTNSLSCRYRVGVQVLDNWGYCNSDGGGKYYDSLYLGTNGQDECDLGPQNPLAAEFYNNYIYISP